MLLTAAQTAPDTLTLAEARGMPSGMLARRVLGAAGVLVESAHVSAGESMWVNPYRLASITFATAPRSAGYPGLCMADTYTAMFRPSDGEDGHDLKADLPSRVMALDRGTRFRKVDAGPVPANGWNAAYGKAMDAVCARTGPVLHDDGTSPFFISLTDGGIDLRGGSASAALSVLATAGASADAGVIACDAGTPADCRRRAAVLALRAPDEVRNGVCETVPARRCVQARYNEGWLHWQTLTLELGAGPGIVAYGAPLPAVHAIRVAEIHAVE